MSVLVSIVPEGRVAVLNDRTYLCDPRNHYIDVVDADGTPLFAFGGRGSRLGQLNTPTDIAVVTFGLPTEDAPDGGAPMLAVADRGNHRIQLFEPDGVAIAAIDGSRGRTAQSAWAPRAGWPFFRLATSVPAFALPSRLTWQAPYLEVTCVGGPIRFDLAAAMLPEFSEWLEGTPNPVLRDALHALTCDPRVESVPDACLLGLVERLQNSRDLLAHDRSRGCA